jgi:hypothetical protein
VQNRWSDLPAVKIALQCSHARLRVFRWARCWLVGLSILAQRLAADAFELPLHWAETPYMQEVCRCFGPAWTAISAVA